ncbi:MAG: hypothetical protein AAF802_13595 [Planctomycetota bacterium]
MLLTSLLAFLTACSKPEPVASSGEETIEQLIPEVPAGVFLEQIFSRYQSAGAYRDEGVVRLGLERDSKSSVQVAPMHVQFDQASLWVAAYDARLWTDGDETIGWIAEPDSVMHDGQVVVGGPIASSESGGRPELPRLLGDSILAARMTLGLGGPPPQLEWLFDADPMARLFESDESNQRIEYDGFSSREGFSCLVVAAAAGNDSYRFHVDRARSMIVAVDLPTSLAGNPVELDGWKIRSLELLLKDATFQKPERPLQLTNMPRSTGPDKPTFVRSLIPLPPPLPHPQIGAAVESFKSVDLTGKIRLGHRGIDRPLTLWFVTPEVSDASDPGLLRSIQTMNSLSLALAPKARSLVRRIVIGDGESVRTLSQNVPGSGLGEPGYSSEGVGQPGSGWVFVDDSRGRLTRALSLSEGQFALSATDGRIRWIGDPSRPGELESLSNLVTDTLAGVDVAEKLRERWRADRKAYEEKLRELSVPRPSALR